MSNSIYSMMNPRTIAVVGANEKGSYGGRMMRNLLAKKFRGEIFPVNPGHDQIYGLKCYGRVSDIPVRVDLAVVIVKAEFVEQIVQECADCGVGGCLIISAGFRELDPAEGPERERRLKAIADRSGMRLIGPNCLGIANPALDMWACALVSLPAVDIAAGHAALISQSGAAGFGPLLNIAIDRAVGLRYIATTGNETDVDMCDLLEFMLEDEDVRAVGLLIEGLKEADRFAALARRALELGKRIVALKIGESEVGSRAAASHTASMTGSMAVFNALARQYGVIKAEDYDEMIELLNILQQDKQLQGKNLAAFAHSGGISGLTGDLLCKHGFAIPVMSRQTQDAANVYLKGFGSPRNPMDMTSHMRKPCLAEIVRAIDANDAIDGYVFATNGPAEGMEHVLAAGRVTDKPSYYIWTGQIDDHDGLDALRAAHVPISFGIQRFAVMLEKVAAARTAAERYAPAPAPVLEGSSGLLNEAEAKGLLSAAGVRTPERVLLPAEPAAADLDRVDFSGGRRYAVKIVSREILHKSDIGGVVLGVSDRAGLERAAEQIRRAGAACGKPVEGILAEEMCADGTDMVVGIRRDDLYGLVLMVGLGGIYTELLHMISIRLLPVSPGEIQRMLDEIPGFTKLAAGYRGQPALDRGALAEAVLRLSELAWANRERLKLLEINPIRVFAEGQGAAALDCVMELD